MRKDKRDRYIWLLGEDESQVLGIGTYLKWCQNFRGFSRWAGSDVVVFKRSGKTGGCLKWFDSDTSRPSF